MHPYNYISRKKLGEYSPKSPVNVFLNELAQRSISTVRSKLDIELGFTMNNEILWLFFW